MSPIQNLPLLNKEELEIYEPTTLPDRPFPLPVIVFLLVIAILAFIDRYLGLNTLILEVIHALVVTATCAI